MERLTLKAQVRENTGKGVARKLREVGSVPAVLYGHDVEPVTLVVNSKDVAPLEGKNALVDIDYGTGKQVAVLKDTQHHPVKGNLLHADFQAINLKEKITITVPVNLTGTPAGISEGGVLSQILREVDVECLPTEMVDSLDVDVTNLNVGDSLSVADIKAQGLDITTDLTEVVATIVVPSMTEEDADAADDMLDAGPEEAAGEAVEGE